MVKTKAVVFVPGYKGSKLINQADGSVHWITAVDALLPGGNLALETVRELGERPGETLVADGILKQISLLYGLYSYDVYGDWLEFLENSVSNHTKVVSVSYDWRKDTMLAVEKLADTIESLHTNGIHDIALVGHSLGGLIVSYYLRYGKQGAEAPVENWQGARQVNRAAVVAAPFLGCMAIFRDLQVGAETVFNDSILRKEVLSGFPSSFQLLPVLDEDIIFSLEGAPIKGATHDTDLWEKYRWGFISDVNFTEDSPIIEKRISYVRNSINKYHDFLLKINASITRNEKLPNTRLLFITGSGWKTFASAIFDSKKRTFEFGDDKRKESLIYRDGDGLITSTALRPPESFLALPSATEVRTKHFHSLAMNDDQTRQAILNFLTAE